jgi:hypothetical protein
MRARAHSVVEDLPPGREVGMSPEGRDHVAVGVVQVE